MSNCAKFKEKDDAAESFFNIVPVACANCGNCKSRNVVTCSVRAELNELYDESPKFKALDHMMRGNRGVRID